MANRPKETTCRAFMIDNRILTKLEPLLADPLTGKTAYGALSSLINSLLEKHLKEQGISIHSVDF